MPVVMQSGYSLPNRTHVLFNNVMTLGNTSVVGETPGNPGVNILDPATYNYWQAPSGPGAQININTANPRSYSGVGISAHNMGSVGASVNVLSSDNGIDYTSVGVSYTAMTNEDVLILFNTILTPNLRINFSAAVAVGVVIAGPCRDFPSTPIDSYTPSHHSKQYTKYFNNSLQGQFLGNRVMGSGGTMSVQFPHIQRDWVDGPLINFEDHYNRGGTFFYAGWPGGKPQDMAYAWPGSEDSIIDVEYVNADKLATVSFDMQFYNPT